MKLATFNVDTAVGSVRRVGIATEESLIDLTEGYAEVLARNGEAVPTDIAEAVVPPDMLKVLRRGDRALDAAQKTLEILEKDPGGVGPGGGQLAHDLESVRLRSPLPRPASLRDFSVYEEHIAKGFPGGLPDIWYDKPLYYKSNAAAVVGPDDKFEWPDYSEKRDYELELAAVIGKQGRNLDANEAMNHVAGFTVFNDFSARDTQFEEMEMNLGPSKGKDFANGLGPYLVTTDAIDPTALDMRASVNGEVVTEGTSAGMQHSWAEMVAYASQGETLYPGDVLGSGTIGNGCGLENGTYLDLGDKVTLEIEGIGTLQNRIASP